MNCRHSFTSLDDMWNRFRHHADAINNRTHRQAQVASGTIVRDLWCMSHSIKLYGLVAGVITGHIALSTIDTQVLEIESFIRFSCQSLSITTHIIDQGHHLLLVVEFFVSTNHWQGFANHVLNFGSWFACINVIGQIKFDYLFHRI
jgi:hypothetical protein